MRVIREVLLEKIRSWVQGSERDKGAHYEDPEAEDRSHLPDKINQRLKVPCGAILAVFEGHRDANEQARKKACVIRPVR